MKSYPYFIALMLFLPLWGAAYQYTNLSNSAAAFPQVMIFRNDTLAANLVPRYQDILMKRSNGFIPKMSTEERTRMPLEELHAIYHRLQNEYPEKLYLLHYNGEAVAVRGFADDEASYYTENLDGYFPGHWAFGAGENLENDVNPTTRSLQVANDTAYKLRDYIFRGSMRDKNEEVSFPTDMLLVAMDEKGRYLWNQSEYVTLESKQAGMLTVKRGRYGSTPKTFSALRTRLLPILGCSWANNAMWCFNFSVDCPRDAQGHQAADVYTGQLVDLVKGSDESRFVEGIAFDVMYFSAPAEIDSDNDGIADGGYINEVNCWRQGILKMLQQLRAELGDSAIITSDSHLATHQRAVGILNGMESEGLVSHNDAFRGISTTINLHSYWQHFSMEPRFSYIADKLRHRLDLERPDELIKLAHGTATALGVNIGLTSNARGYLLDDRYPYLHAGPSDEPGWLGLPISGMTLIGETGAEFSRADEIMNGVEVQNGHIHSAGKGEWAVVGNDQGFSKEISSSVEHQQKKVRKGVALKNIELVITNLDLSRGLTLKMDLKSEAVLPGLEGYPKVPRFVMAELSNVEYHSNPQIDEQHQSLGSVMGAADWHPTIFYFRPNSAKDATLTLSFEEMGDFRIRNPEILTGPLVIGRLFEHGAVAVNLSEENVTVPFRAGMINVETNEKYGHTLQLSPLEAQFLSNEPF